MERLARRFNASIRTVRSHIHQANSALEGVARITFSRTGNGYRLDVTDPQALTAWVDRSHALAGASDRSASEERALSLAMDLLQRSDWVTIANLADMLYVSPQSVSGDLKAVSSLVERFGLEVVRRPRYGVRIDGPEMPRRLCLASLISKKLLSNGVPSWDAGQDRVVQQVAACVNDALQDADITIGYGALQNLVVHVSVAIERIRSDCYVPLDEERLAALRGAKEFPVAQRIAQKVGRALNVEMPETEVAYIAIHLAGKKTLDKLVEAGSSDDAGGAPAISDEVWTAVGDILDRVWESSHLDFRSDLELRMNLARHLAPLSVRLRYGLRMENPLLADIKTRYPLAYSIAADAAGVLAEHYDAEPSEDEIGYLALAFALALERQRTGASKKNVLMVCGSGMGTARMLEYRFKQAFSGYIDTIRTCDAHDAARQDFSTIDYVFTTVPLEQELPVPVCQINFFFEDTDAGDIRRILNGRPAARNFLAHFSPDLFLPHLDVASRRETIGLLCERMARRVPVDEGFLGSVLAREEAAATSFGNGVAMPHPLRAMSDATHVCVGLLDKPVAWGDMHQVQAVFLFSYARSGGRALDDFFSTCADIFMDADAMRRLIQDQSWETLVSIIQGR